MSAVAVAMRAFFMAIGTAGMRMRGEDADDGDDRQHLDERETRERRVLAALRDTEGGEGRGTTISFAWHGWRLLAL